MDLSAIQHAIELRLAEVAALPTEIQTWMKVMRAIFVSSILFAFWKKEARVVLLVTISTAILLFGFKTAYPEIHSADIGRSIHLVLWTGLLAYLLWRRDAILTALTSRRAATAIYGVWLLAVALVLTVSLGFDFAYYAR